MLRPNAELVAPPQELLFRRAARRGVVHADVVQVDAALVLAVESAHVGRGAVRLEHDGDAVQLLMPG